MGQLRKGASNKTRDHTRAEGRETQRRNTVAWQKKKMGEAPVCNAMTAAKRLLDQLTSDTPFPPLHTQTNHTNQLALPHCPVHTLLSLSHALLGAEGEGGEISAQHTEGPPHKQHKHHQKGFSAPLPPPHTPAHPPPP